MNETRVTDGTADARAGGIREKVKRFADNIGRVVQNQVEG
jgi:hypothetical protein